MSGARSRLVVATLVVVVASSAGCFQGLARLAPFPCAADGTCPDALVCVPDVGCANQAIAEAALPYPCSAGGSCAFADELFLDCVPDVGCTTFDGAAAALPYACDDDGSCAFESLLELDCISGVGCANAAIAEASTPYPCTPEGSCAFGFQLPVECVPDLGCATAAQAAAAAPFPCDALNRCAFDVEAELGCVPGIGCVDVDAARNAAPFACEAGVCPSFGAVEFACFDAVGCAEPNACDVVEQSGCAGDEPKCTTSLLTGTSFATRCVAAGVVDDDGVCERPTNVPGVDDCANGFCSALGAANDERRCRSYCDAASLCDVDEVCVNNFFTTDYGVCAPPCDILQAGGCLADQSCKGTNTALDGSTQGTCLADGPSAFGATCTSNDDCQSFLVCFVGVCTPVCNVDVACPADATCLSTTERVEFCECDAFGAFCAAGLACTVFGSDANGYFNACDSVGAGAAGDACVENADCQSSLCFTFAGQQPACTDLCDESHPCANLAECTLLVGETFGVCPNL
jgi:hypothetical protein